MAGRQQGSCGKRQLFGVRPARRRFGPPRIALSACEYVAAKPPLDQSGARPPHSKELTLTPLVCWCGIKLKLTKLLLVVLTPLWQALSAVA